MTNYIETEDTNKVFLVVDGEIINAINSKCEEWQGYLNYKASGGTLLPKQPSQFHEFRMGQWVLNTGLQTAYMKQLENAVDQHIRTTCASKGYDSENSLSKYMARPNSPWYAECIAIGDWIDACWLKCHDLMNAVHEGTRPVPTAEELIAELPGEPSIK